MLEPCEGAAFCLCVLLSGTARFLSGSEPGTWSEKNSVPSAACPTTSASQQDLACLGWVQLPRLCRQPTTTKLHRTIRPSDEHNLRFTQPLAEAAPSDGRY